MPWKRFENPELFVTTGHSGLSGEGGTLPGHVHWCCPKAGIEFQCADCHAVSRYSWAMIEARVLEIYDAHGELSTVALPPCPHCGAQPFLAVNNVEYGIELPHHYTSKAADRIADRPALRHCVVRDRHYDHERFQGKDFSHLPAKARPPHHVRLGAYDPEHADEAQ